MTSTTFNLTKTVVKPDLKLFPKEALKYFDEKFNTRNVWKFTTKLSKLTDDDKYLLNLSRAQIIRNRCRLPIKYLAPDYEYNRYICQKAPLKDVSNSIDNASKVIEPLNFGFDDVIRTILINQNIPLGTVFEIDIHNPYESSERVFFRSKSLKNISNLKINGELFDPNIHIGTLDIGGRFMAKYTVEYLNLNLFDSYQLFSYEILDDPQNDVWGFAIKIYDFCQVDVKYVFDEVLKLADEKTKTVLTNWMKLIK